MKLRDAALRAHTRALQHRAHENAKVAEEVWSAVEASMKRMFPTGIKYRWVRQPWVHDDATVDYWLEIDGLQLSAQAKRNSPYVFWFLRDPSELDSRELGEPFSSLEALGELIQRLYDTEPDRASTDPHQTPPARGRGPGPQSRVGKAG